MILFSQQETPNWLSTYASFNLLASAPATALPPARFSFRSFVSFHPFSCYSIPFGGASRSVTFQSVLAISALLRFRVFVRPLFSPMATHRRRRLLSRAEWNLRRVAAGRDERANARRSRNHFITLQSRRHTKARIFGHACRRSPNCIACETGFAAETLTKRKAEIRIARAWKMQRDPSPATERNAAMERQAAAACTTSLQKKDGNKTGFACRGYFSV